MNGDMGGNGPGDGGDATSRPAPEAPRIGEGNTTAPTDAPRIGTEIRERPASNGDNTSPVRVERIQDLRVYDGPKPHEAPAGRPDAELLTTEKAREIAARFAISEGLVQEQGHFLPSPRNAELAVAGAYGTEPFGGKVPVDVPVPAQPGEDPNARAGFEVKTSGQLGHAERQERFAVVYGTYAKSDLVGLPDQWDEDWGREPMSPENQTRARQVAEALHRAVQLREAEGAREHKVDPERVTVIAFPYDPRSRDAQILQFERDDVFPDPSRLDWHFSEEGKGLIGVDREHPEQTVVNWNRDRGQINVRINPAEAIRVSDIFSLKLPDGHGKTTEQWIETIYPGLLETKGQGQQ